MHLTNRIKRIGLEKLNNYSFNPYEKYRTYKGGKFPIWAKIAIPLGSSTMLLTSTIVIGVITSVLLVNSFAYKKEIFLGDYAINHTQKHFNAKKEEITNKAINFINSYTTEHYKYVYNMTSSTYSNSNKIDVPKNFVLSPLATLIPLFVLREGANTETRNQINQAFNIDDSINSEDIKKILSNNLIKDMENNEIYVDFSNALFASEDAKMNNIDKDYLETLTDNYFTDVYLNYKQNETSEIIRQYINQKLETTNLKIDFSILNSSANLMSTSLFKSSWGIKPLRSDAVLPFTNADGTIVERENLVFHFRTNIKDYSNHYEITLPLQKDYQFNIFYSKTLDTFNSVLSNDLFNKDASYKNKDVNLTLCLPKFNVDTNAFYDGTFMFWSEKGIPNFEDKSIFQTLSKFGENKGRLGLMFNSTSFDVNEFGVYAKSLEYSDQGTPAGGDIESMSIKIDRPFAYSVTTGDEIPLYIGTFLES